METILSHIVKDKEAWLEKRMKTQPLIDFIDEIIPSGRNFYQALTRPETVFILECKKASPSKGLIRADFDPETIADIYHHYASVISVLTDEKYFQGSFDYLSLVSRRVTQPILCKDFIISAYQIYLARYYQADAVLLMLSVLSDAQYLELAAVAHQLNMGILTEVSNQNELERAINLKSKVVGINNRDLRDLSIDLNTTRRLAPQLPKETIVISESGIHSHEQVLEISRFANGFLIGSALMADNNLDLAIRQIMFGINKVCGLTRLVDANDAYRAGAIYGGVIFAARSPRNISLEEAIKITQAVPLKWVGIFTDEKLDKIIAIARQLKLCAIQLHRNEVSDEIRYLRHHLPETCQIWQAQSVKDTQPQLNQNQITHYVLDNGPGGTGKTFNWKTLQGVDLSNVILAGGLNADNANQAAELGSFALDFNSGLETSPGIKDREKITKLFQTLRLNKR